MGVHYAQAAVVHVRFEGRSQDVSPDALNVDSSASDAALRQALARYLEVPEEKLRDYVIDRHENGNWTVRPEAVFG